MLYTLIGTTYGGDGQVTFAVPDLRGRIALHQGTGPGLTTRVIGETSGVEGVTLTGNQLGGHTHLVEASAAPASATAPTGNVLATVDSADSMYLPTTTGSVVTILPCVQSTGNGLPHENCAPTLTLLPCIATAGIFPSQG